MPFTISPAVMVTETDQTQIVGAVSSTVAAFAGDFQWGPCYTPRLIDSEQALVQTFWKPNDRVATDFFTAWNFLNYGDSLQLVRICNTTSNTAKNACSANSTGPQVLNDTIYEHYYTDGSLDTEFSTGEFIAAFPGALGNSLSVHVCPSTNAYSRTLTGTLNANSFSKIVRGTGTAFTTQMVVGDRLRLNGEIHPVASIANSTYLELSYQHVLGATGANTGIRYWKYYNEFNGAPGTTTYAEERDSLNDELHIVVTDADGKWTGTPGTILESFGFCSKALDARNQDGTSAYYRDVLLTQSKYVRWASHAATMTNAGTSIAASGATTFGGYSLPTSGQLRGGSNGATITNSEKIRGFDLFKSAEEIDITLVLGGVTDSTLAAYLVQNIAEARMDAVAFITVPMSTVVDNAGAEDIDCESFRGQLTSSSYGFLDGNWKYQYDKWNDTYRWLPTNGDMAGLMARTASLQDPWWSPAGYNRGYLKNTTKLAWNPRKAYRDHLYRSQINPIISDHGSGPLLLGDKTLLAKESAFGYINVRMLFIILEKAIATAAKFQLFEFNDEFSWAAFKNMVEPYLRDVKARRGLRNFKVVCDATNNTSQVINSGGFKADLYILPNRSTQWVWLNFIAVADGVMFTEKTGTS